MLLVCQTRRGDFGYISGHMQLSYVYVQLSDCGVGGAEVVLTCRILDSFVPLVVGGGCGAWAAAADLAGLVPQALNVAASEEVDASPDTSSDGFRFVLLRTQDEELDVKEEPKEFGGAGIPRGSIGTGVGLGCLDIGINDAEEDVVELFKEGRWDLFSDSGAEGGRVGCNVGSDEAEGAGP